MMTAFEKIIDAIKDFNYPYAPDIYTGNAQKWFTYNFADDYGEAFSNNEPGYTISVVQVHFFLPSTEDFLQIKNEIRKALFHAGFTLPEITVSLESDNNLRHITFECSITEEF